jgi:membrane protein implicated in regulation of membrane protease activity
MVALVFEGAVILGADNFHIGFLLTPGMILSALISGGSNTGNFSFAIGVVINAIFYTYLVSLLAKAVDRRRAKDRTGDTRD